MQAIFDHPMHFYEAVNVMVIMDRDQHMQRRKIKGVGR